MLLVEDRQLLERFRRGEPQALGHVFEHYQPGVLATVRHALRTLQKTGRIRDCDEFDLVHETFRSAFEPRARQSYGGLKPYAAYLSIVAKNHCLSRFRRGRVSGESAPLEEVEQIASPALSPEELTLRAEQRAALASFLSQLSAEEREFTRLRFEEDLAQEAVAERLGVGRKKVRLLEIAVKKRLQSFAKGLRAEP